MYSKTSVKRPLKSKQNKGLNDKWSIYLCISTASHPLEDYVQVRVSAVLVEEMLLKTKSGIKDNRVKMLKVRNRLTVIG